MFIRADHYTLDRRVQYVPVSKIPSEMEIKLWSQIII